MDNTPSASQKKSRLARKLLIATGIWVIVALSGLRLYFGPDELHGTKAVQAAVVGISSGIIFWGFVIATIVAYIAGRQKQTTSVREASTAKHLSVSRLIIGLILMFGPWATYMLLFSQRGPTNAQQETLMLILGNTILVPLVFLIVGFMMVYNAIARYSYEPGTAPPMFDRKNRLSWLGNGFGGAIFAFIALAQWKAESDIIQPWWVATFLIVLTAGVILISKASTKKSWATAIIGDPALTDDDEREASLLNQAGRYSLAASFSLVNIVLVILMLAPKPSIFAFVYLFIGMMSIQRGLYGFFAWKLGLR